jgi:hypothetical protein
MTRAKEYLCLPCSGESKFTEYFERIREERKRGKKEIRVNNFLIYFFVKIGSD